jgi:hypothetical protein
MPQNQSENAIFNELPPPALVKKTTSTKSANRSFVAQFVTTTNRAGDTPDESW